MPFSKDYPVGAYQHRADRHFAPRCRFVTDRATAARPTLADVGAGHLKACFVDVHAPVAA